MIARSQLALRVISIKTLKQYIKNVNKIKKIKIKRKILL